ncbi:MAG: 3-phosphoshikimate 1-carboxyvinyltransferase [Coriobacteriia bacterium]|nr:3-phosphoshikimate 1-carboxyvinyltransferase [Coriobacteriia bacterium]
MDLRVRAARSPLVGSLRVPSDKSISHRAVLFAAMAEGVSRLRGVLDSADVRSTMGAVAALGAGVRVVDVASEGLELEVTGWGSRGPVSPGVPIDCGNSGTTVRLLMGILAGWPVDVTLSGDESLSARPMRRVTDPLTTMGAVFETSAGGSLPVRIHGGGLSAVSFASPVASAQVKSAVLLAGLRAVGTTTVTEQARSRDHTERMLPAFGVPVTVEASDLSASVDGPAGLHATEVVVPADPSSAAFFSIAASIVPRSQIVLRDVSLNPTRIGFLRVLDRMGARIRRSAPTSMGAEDIATLTVSAAPALSGTTVTPEEVPSLIDEVPILALIATQASGTTRFEGVGELRVKESDRLEAVRSGLEALGAHVEAGEDWLEVTGPTPLRGTRVPSLGDHRLAMMWTVAGLVAEGETVVEGFEACDVSYPRFGEDLSALGAPVLRG